MKTPPQLPNQSGMDESVFQIWLVNPVMTSSSQGQKGRKRPEAFYVLQTFCLSLFILIDSWTADLIEYRLHSLKKTDSSPPQSKFIED